MLANKPEKTQAQTPVTTLEKPLDILRLKIPWAQEYKQEIATKQCIIEPGFQPGDKLWLNTKNV